MKCIKFLCILSWIFIFCSILISIVISIIVVDKRISKKEFVYYLSKVATMKNIVKINHNSKIFDHFNSDGDLEGITTKYNKLLNLTTSEGCKEGYKKCGILDTLGNTLCIDNNFVCPINKLTVDLLANKNKYLNQGLKEIYNENLIYNYKFYYSNESLDGNSIVSLLFSDEKPRYITLNNFVVDLAAYKQYFKDNLNNQNNDIEDNGIKFGENLINIFVHDDYVEQLIKASFSLISLIEDSDNDKEEFRDYVLKKLETVENKIDKYYLNVGENAYIKNYIGFKSLNDVNRFMNFDYNIYKDKYPTYTAYILASITLSFGLLFLSVSLVYFWAFSKKYKNKLRSKEYNNNNKINETQKLGDKTYNNNKSTEIQKLGDKEYNNIRCEKIIYNNNETTMNINLDDAGKNNDEKKDDLIFCLYEFKPKKSYIFPAILSLIIIGLSLALLIYSAIVLHRNHNDKKKLKILDNIESDDFIQSFLFEFKKECKISSLFIPTITLLGCSILIHGLGIYFMIIVIINLEKN